MSVTSSAPHEILFLWLAVGCSSSLKTPVKKLTNRSFSIVKRTTSGVAVQLTMTTTGVVVQLLTRFKLLRIEIDCLKVVWGFKVFDRVIEAHCIRYEMFFWQIVAGFQEAQQISYGNFSRALNFVPWQALFICLVSMGFQLELLQMQWHVQTEVF